MAATWMYNVFAGAETGILKGINTGEKKWENLNSIADAKKSKEILTLCWETDRENKICAGRRDNTIITWCAEKQIQEEGEFQCESGGHIKTIAKLNNHYITGFSNGVVKFWHDDAVTTLESGENLYAFAQSSVEGNIIATGGKENPLKLWDLIKTNQEIFTAKNVRNDWLNLRVPVWVTRAAFLDARRRIVTGTGYHQVRLYDPLSPMRRPVLDMTFREHPVTGLSVRPGMELQVVVGNTHGDMGLLDLRKGKMVNLFKGFSGGITDIQCHPTAPFIVSCGVDRYVHVHNIESREHVHKFYLKSRLNCVLLSNVWSDELQRSGASAESGKVTQRDSMENIDSMEDIDSDIWGSFDVVKTQTVKKSAKKRKLKMEVK